MQGKTPSDGKTQARRRGTGRSRSGGLQAARSTVVVAAPCPTLRGWLARGLQCAEGSVREVASGWEALVHLAENEVELVVTSAKLPDLHGLNLLGMVRTAGLGVPFIVVEPIPATRLVAAIRRMPPAALLDDWSDTSALRALRDELCPAKTAWGPLALRRRVA